MNRLPPPLFACQHQVPGQKGRSEHTDDGHLAWGRGILSARCGHKTKGKTKEKTQCDEKTEFGELHDGVAIDLHPSRFSSLLIVAKSGDCLVVSECRGTNGFGQDSLGLVIPNNSLPCQRVSGIMCTGMRRNAQCAERVLMNAIVRWGKGLLAGT